MRLAIAAFAAAMLAAAPTGAQTTTTRGTPMTADARLQRLEDIQAIGRVLTDYGRLLDARDFRGYADLFAVDGVWDGGFGAARGPQAIYDMMAKNIGTGQGGGMPSGSYHLLTSFEIDPHGDTAVAWSRWSFVVQGKDGGHPQIFGSGRYEDQLVREAGRWKFKLRKALSDAPVPPPK